MTEVTYFYFRESASNHPNIEIVLEWEPDETFDVAVCVMGVHYHEGKELEQFLKQARRTIRPSGLFVCAQPSAPNELADVFEILEAGTFPFSNRSYTTNLPYLLGRNSRSTL